MKRATTPFRHLSAAEQTLMNFVWARGPVTAEACVDAWVGRPIKDSTARTMLRRMEAKGYIVHSTVGRTFVYRALEQREHVAVRAVKHLLDRFCGGSAEELVVGMVHHQVIDGEVLKRIARRLEAEKSSGKRGTP